MNAKMWPVFCLLAACNVYPNTGKLYDPDGDGVLLGDDCDNDDSSVGVLHWYPDKDADGYGDGADGIEGCEELLGMVTLAGDCDDTDREIHPEASEWCDDIDNDCDDQIDNDARDANTFELDVDGDGYADPSSTIRSCLVEVAGAWPVGETDPDCDDQDDQVYPGAPESCDDVDQDCDGEIDDDPEDPLSWYPDEDEDGYGDEEGTPELACDQPSGRVSNDADCDDDDSTISPEAAETWYDGVDQDCDQRDDFDADEDGARAETYGGDDCDDSTALVGPTIAEVCGDGLDNDCDDDATPCAYAGDYEDIAATGHGAIELTGDALDLDTVGDRLIQAGDLSGDGVPDILIGSVGTNASELSAVSGRFYLLSDVAGAVSAGGGAVSDHSLWFTGEEGSAGLGMAMDGSADLDDDDQVDLILGSSGVTSYDGEVLRAGRVYVLSGPLSIASTGGATGEIILSSSSISAIDGDEDSGKSLGGAVLARPPGSFGDDAANLLARGRSAIWGFHGDPMTMDRSSTELEDVAWQISTDPSYSLSQTLASADLDGDGESDLVVGDPSNNQAVGLCDGIHEGLDGLALDEVDDGTINIDVLSDVGYDVQNIGDLNADGYEELALAATISDAGSVAILSGANASALCDGSSVTEADLFIQGIYYGGGSPALPEIAGGKDVDQSGEPDIMFSSPNCSSDNGCVYLLMDPGVLLDGGATIDDAAGDAIFMGPADGRLGTSLLMVDDVLSDSGDFAEEGTVGFPDMLFGAPGTSGGTIYLFPGNGY